MGPGAAQDLKVKSRIFPLVEYDPSHALQSPGLLYENVP